MPALASSIAAATMAAIANLYTNITKKTLCGIIHEKNIL
jgi:hypothetical protein